MEENLADYRKSYEKDELRAEELTPHPMDFFKRWFDEAEKSARGVEANAMTISTVDENGYPKNRVVLLKKFTDSGFVFYTNYQSEKGRSILRHPKVSASFFWPWLERQVIVKGDVVQLPAEESDAYFAVRPRGSQIGAWVSRQSQPIESRRVLEERRAAMTQRFAGRDIPRPDFWGGFLIQPNSVEFWQGRPDRLHDRFRYSGSGKNQWKRERLSP